jgi:hypothetical protein
VGHGNCFLHTIAGAEVIRVVLIFLTGKVLVVLTAGGACDESRGVREGVGTGSGPVMGVIWDALGAVIGFLWDGFHLRHQEFLNSKQLVCLHHQAFI